MNVIGNFTSYFINVPSGVPQGGHLSPLLFLIFTDDTSNIFLYGRFLVCADDVKLYLPIDSVEHSIKLQIDLNYKTGFRI